MQKKGREPKLPDAPLPYLIEYLFEVGPTQGGGFGPTPITHAEILAWQTNMRRTLQPWEVSMLRRLSVQWIVEAQRAEDPNCAPPWDGETVTSEEKRAVASSLRDAIRGMAR